MYFCTNRVGTLSRPRIGIVSKPCQFGVRNSVRIEVGRHLHDDPAELHGGRLVGFHLIFEKITELLQPRDQRPDVIL